MPTPEGSGDEGSAKIPPVDESGNATIVLNTRTFNQTYEREISRSLRIPYLSHQSGVNCLAFDADVIILRGNATATWEPVNDFAERLELDFYVSGGVGRVGLAQGASPLRLEFENISGEGGNDYWLAVESVDPGVFVDQTIQVTLALTYLHDEDIEINDRISCGIG